MSTMYESDALMAIPKRGKGLILGISFFYVAFVFFLLYVLPMLARQAEESCMKRKGPRLYKSTVPETDIVVHIVFVCSTLSVLCSLGALTLYFRDFSDDDLIEIIMNPRDNGPKWVVMGCNFLGALAPMVLRNSSHGAMRTLDPETRQTHLEKSVLGD